VSGRIGIQRGRKLTALPSTVIQVDDLVVAVLTGGRPELLTKTLDTLLAHAGSRLLAWSVVAVVNGADTPTMQVLRERPWVTVIPIDGTVRPIGPAVSTLMEAASATGRRFVLQLEDDWCCLHPPVRWLDRAVHALQDPAVGQVRLRLASEKVMRTNMRTGAAIRWESAPDHHRSSNAHFTFNPNIVRASSVPKIYPCLGELDAQRRFAELGQAVVQILPGSFTHTGEHASLRERLQRNHGP
jgi:hypothetical protein